VKRRIALVTTYNPGALGPRFVAGHLIAHGHEVKFVHLKNFCAAAIPTQMAEEHRKRELAACDVEYVAFQHPGEVLFSPYPFPITDREMELFVQEIESYRPDAVGISLFSVTAEIARRATRAIRKRLPGLPVIWGGIHCQIAPDDCVRGLSPDPQTGAKDEAAVPDALCIAEGEAPMLALLERWDDYRAAGTLDLPGFWFAHAEQVTRNARPPLEQNLDNYSFPAYAVNEVLIENDRVDTMYSDPRGPIRYHILLLTERGCPYHCSYCVNSIMNTIEPQARHIRRRSVDNVLAEVEKRVTENGVTHFPIYDEIFAIQKPWIMEFAAKWKQRFKPRGITFNGYFHPLASTPDMVDALWDAGMSSAGFAIQSGSRRVVEKVYDRIFDRQKIIDMSRRIAQFPFQNVQVDLLCDSPYETEEDRRETLELLLEMAPPFQVETCGLVTYSYSALAHKERVRQSVPWEERLFWNMLYHLAGSRQLRPETIRALSHDTYLRQNPLELEKLAIDLRGEGLRNPGILRPLGCALPPEQLAPPPQPPAQALAMPATPVSFPRRVKRFLRRLKSCLTD
jgi:anaerobic magnesium-protoporphyrin IX monomethyl ester cyclase